MVVSLGLTILLAASGCASHTAVADGIPAGKSKQELLAGNQRFVSGGMKSHAWQQERVIQTGSMGQSPSVGVLSCADSRVPVEIIFDQGVGDLFVVRMAGNFENPAAVGTFEYGVAALGVHTLLVLGHTKCGAVEAALAGKALPGDMPVFTSAVAPAIAAMPKSGATSQGSDGKPDLTSAVEANVRWQLAKLLEHSEILRKAKADGKLTVYGAIYDVDTGRVRFLD